MARRPDPHHDPGIAQANAVANAADKPGPGPFGSWVTALGLNASRSRPLHRKAVAGERDVEYRPAMDRH